MSDRDLMTMGASWFVMKAYSFYCDRSDTRFQDLFTTLQSRESAFKKSKANHRIYLMNILKMSDKQLSTNKANIPGKEIKILAQKILVNHFETEGNDGNVYATRMDNMKNKKENELNKDNYPYKPFNSLRDSSFNINRFGWHDRNELGFLKAWNTKLKRIVRYTCLTIGLICLIVLIVGLCINVSQEEHPGLYVGKILMIALGAFFLFMDILMFACMNLSIYVLKNKWSSIEKSDIS